MIYCDDKERKNTVWLRGSWTVVHTYYYMY